MKHVLLCASLLSSVCFINSAHAADIIASEASGALISLSLAGGTISASGALIPTSGSGNVYDDQISGTINQSLSLNAGTILSGLVTLDESLTSGVVNSHSFASTTTVFHGIPISETGTVDILNPKLNITSTLLHAIPLAALGISADEIVSTSVAGQKSGGGYFATGSSTLTGLSITGGILGSLNIDGSLYANPAANTVLLNTGIVKIILNEQLTTSDASGASIVTNAVHVVLSDFFLNGKAISGDIILGHSAASVPEPATWSMMILGLGLIGQAMRKATIRASLRRREPA